MNDGKTKSAAGLYTRVDLDEVLYTDNFSVCKNCIGCGKCGTVCPQQLHIREDLKQVQATFDGLLKE